MGYLAKFTQNWYALYVNQTPAEAALEPYLAKCGRVVRFQHPMLGNIILDFAFLDAKIAVEVDGKSHHTAKGRAKDALRDARMAKHGWLVLRVSNEDALADPGGWVQLHLIPKLETRNYGHTD